MEERTEKSEEGSKIIGCNGYYYKRERVRIAQGIRRGRLIEGET